MIEYIGDPGYGGWFTETKGLNASSVVYSLGIGENISWDLGMIDRFGCNVYAFDMTPRVSKWLSQQKLSRHLIFEAVGVSDRDGTETFEFKEGKVDVSIAKRFGTSASSLNLPVKSLRTIMTERGHTHIDILKMDIEGAEYKVLPQVLQLNIHQILFESHRRFFVGWKGLRPILYGNVKTWVLLWRLWWHGYRVIHCKTIDRVVLDKDYLLVRKILDTR
jgi:FkbM family methyltransferase